MVRTALLLDDFLKRHRTAEGHPECPERLDAIGSSLAPLQNVVVLSSRRAGLDEIGLCHDPRYVEEVLAPHCVWRRRFVGRRRERL